MTSPKTTYSALGAAILAILYFALEKWGGVDIPSEIEGAIGVIVFTLIGALGTFARDNNRSSEDVGLKDRVVGTVGAGSTIQLAQPVEVLEPEPLTTPEPAVQGQDPQ